jgi:hypothetical protein
MPEDRYDHLATRDHPIGNSSRPARRPPSETHAPATQLPPGPKRRRERSLASPTMTSFVAYSSQETVAARPLQRLRRGLMSRRQSAKPPPSS